MAEADYNDDYELDNDLSKLRSAYQEQRIDGAFRLSALSDTRALPSLLRVLKKDPSPDVRASAAWGLAHYNDHRMIEPLCQALDDPEAEVRQMAAFALGQVRDRRSVGPLLKHLQESDENTLKSIIIALGRQEDPRALEPLMKLLEQDRPYLDEYIVRALGQIGDPEANSVLKIMLDHPALAVQTAAQEALEHIEHLDRLNTAPEHHSWFQHGWFQKKASEETES